MPEWGRWSKEKEAAVGLREEFVSAIQEAREGMKLTRLVRNGANIDGHQDDEEDRMIWACTEETWAKVTRAFELAEAVADNPYIWPGVDSLGEANRLAYHMRSPLLERVETDRAASSP